MAHETPHTATSYPDHVNKHLVRVEDDLIFVRFMGRYEPDDAKMILTLMERIYHERGSVFFLGDLTQAETPGPATRRLIAEWVYPWDVLTASYFGASWTLRAVATLIHSAVHLMRRKPVSTFYAKTEAEARAWIDEQRLAQARQ